MSDNPTAPALLRALVDLVETMQRQGKATRDDMLQLAAIADAARAHLSRRQR